MSSRRTHWRSTSDREGRWQEGPRHRGGFTLIELLLAVAIFGVVLVAVNTVFFAALKLRNRTTENLDRSLPLAHALGVLREDLMGAVPPGSAMTGYFQYAPGNSGANSLSGQSAKSSTGGTTSSMQVQGSLTFFTTSARLSEDQPWADIQQVSYELLDPVDNNKASGKDLVRYVNRNLLGYSSQVPETQRLAGNIDTLEFEFFGGSQWQTSWDTTTGQTGLPLAVRVRLHLASERMSTVRMQPVEMVVLLEAQGNTTPSSSNTVSSASSTLWLASK